MSWAGSIRLDRWLVIAVLAALSCVFLISVTQFPFYSSSSNVEELTLTYTSAGNYLKYGFLNSGLLQDFSTSSNPADHPYAYNHMPPGPDIVTALLMAASGGSYRAVRIAFWLVFLAGIGCYLRFADLVLGRLGLQGAGYTMLFFNPIILLRTMDDPVYAPFPLWAFLPLLTLTAHYRTKRPAYLYLTLTLGLLSSLYLEYLALSVVVYCWVLLYFTGLLRIERRHLIAYLGVIAAGVALHLLQNLLYLGPSLFFEELRMTLTNRIIGVPSKAVMKDFYQAVGMVHHGSTPLNLSGFLANLRRALWFPGRDHVLLVAVVSLGWMAARGARGSRVNGSSSLLHEPPAALRYFGALAVWIAGTLILSMLMFPAFTQEYGLAGVGLNSYFLALGLTAILLYAFRHIAEHWPRSFSRKAVLRWDSGLAILVLLLVVWSIRMAVKFHVERYEGLLPELREFRYAKLEDLRQRFSGQIFMTNINPVPVGFFVGEAGHGVCDPASLPEAGGVDVGKCHVSYVRRQDYYKHTLPRYFFFFRDLYPGFSECLPSAMTPQLNRGGDACLDLIESRLSIRFPKVYDNGLFKVFDLHAVK